MSGQITATTKTDNHAISGTIVGDKKGLDINLVGSSERFSVPPLTDYILESKPTPDVQIFQFYQGGAMGTLLKTITITTLPDCSRSYEVT